MSSILYYSNYCENCKGLLQTISKWPSVQKDMHFLNIDKRAKKTKWSNLHNFREWTGNTSSSNYNKSSCSITFK